MTSPSTKSKKMSSSSSSSPRKLKRSSSSSKMKVKKEVPTQTPPPPPPLVPLDECSSNTTNSTQSKTSPRKLRRSSSSSKMKVKKEVPAPSPPPPPLVPLDECSSNSSVTTNSSQSMASSSADMAAMSPTRSSSLVASHLDIVTIMSRVSSPTAGSAPPSPAGKKSKQCVRFSENTTKTKQGKSSSSKSKSSKKSSSKHHHKHSNEQQQQSEEEDISCELHEIEKIPSDDANNVWYSPSEMNEIRRDATMVVQSLKQDEEYLWAANMMYEQSSPKKSKAKVDKVKLERAYRIMAEHHDAARGLEMHMDATAQQTMQQHVSVVEKAQAAEDVSFLRKESRKGSKLTANYATVMAELDAQEAAVAYYTPCCDGSDSTDNASSSED